jgi:hypothetical protein
LASACNFAFTLPGGDVVAVGSLTGTEVGSTGVYDLSSGTSNSSWAAPPAHPDLSPASA